SIAARVCGVVRRDLGKRHTAQLSGESRTQRDNFHRRALRSISVLGSSQPAGTMLEKSASIGPRIIDRSDQGCSSICFEIGRKKTHSSIWHWHDWTCADIARRSSIAPLASAAFLTTISTSLKVWSTATSLSPSWNNETKNWIRGKPRT